jgi:hypothetical protein
MFMSNCQWVPDKDVLAGEPAALLVISGSQAISSGEVPAGIKEKFYKETESYMNYMIPSGGAAAVDFYRGPFQDFYAIIDFGMESGGSRYRYRCLPPSPWSIVGIGAVAAVAAGTAFLVAKRY